MNKIITNEKAIIGLSKMWCFSSMLAFALAAFALFIKSNAAIIFNSAVYFLLIGILIRLFSKSISKPEFARLLLCLGAFIIPSYFLMILFQRHFFLNEFSQSILGKTLSEFIFLSPAIFFTALLFLSITKLKTIYNSPSVEERLNDFFQAKNYYRGPIASPSLYVLSVLECVRGFLNINVKSFWSPKMFFIMGIFFSSIIYFFAF